MPESSSQHPETGGPLRPDTVLERATQGYRTTLVAQAVRLGCKAVSVFVVARLVTPTDQGLYAMAGSVTLFFWMFRDLGLGTAAIQTPVLTTRLFTTVIRAQLAIGAALTLLTLAVAPLASHFYGQPQLTALLAFMSPSFLLIGIGGLPRALLIRKLRFREFNLVETAAALTATLAMIFAAWAGAGPYSFAVFLLVSDFVFAVTAWRYCLPLPRGDEGSNRFSRLLQTGIKLTYSQTLYQLAQLLETAVVGRFFGTHTVGLYNRASQILTLPVMHVAEPVSQIALTTLSQLNHTPDAFRAQGARSINVTAYLTLPITALALAAPTELIHLVLGGRWVDAAPLLQWIAVSLGLSQIALVSQSAAIASGHSRRLPVIAGTSLIVVAAAIFLGARQSALGVARAIAIANLLLFLPRIIWCLRGSPLGVTTYLRTLAGPAASASLLGCGAFAGHLLAAPLGFPLQLFAVGSGACIMLALGGTASRQLRGEWREASDYLNLTGFFRRPPTSSAGRTGAR